jgi:hypothetical protein
MIGLLRSVARAGPGCWLTGAYRAGRRGDSQAAGIGDHNPGLLTAATKLQTFSTSDDLSLPLVASTVAVNASATELHRDRGNMSSLESSNGQFVLAGLS